MIIAKLVLKLLSAFYKSEMLYVVVFYFFPCEKSVIEKILSDKQLESPSLWMKFSPTKIQIISICVWSQTVIKPHFILIISVWKESKSEMQQKLG